jgi:ABC-type branched-subunit amino acid transport system ATPase component
MPTSSGERTARPSPLLVVRDFSAGYGGPPVISGLSIDVGVGEVVTVVGPNGAGKSTLLKGLAGVAQYIGGTVEFDGTDMTAWPTARLARAGVGYVPQSREVFGDLTVHENLEMGGVLMPKREVAARIEEVVSMLPLLKGMMKRRADKLSGGERKVLAIARALMSRPRILLLDEPTSGLTAELSTEILRTEVAGLASTGTAILLVEQKALAALEVSDWTYVLASGTTRLSAPSSELLRRSDLGDVFLGEVTETEIELVSGTAPADDTLAER